MNYIKYEDLQKVNRKFQIWTLFLPFQYILDTNEFSSGLCNIQRQFTVNICYL